MNTHNKAAFLGPVAILILYGLLLALLAMGLNQHFYALHGPFYDSMSYYNQMAMVMQRTQEDGLWSTLKLSTTHTTVFLPWLLAAMLSYVTEPSRLLGVVIQMPLVYLQLFTGYRFFRATGTPALRATLYTLPLVTYAGIFHFNGGLGDFRMDLAQALGYGSFIAALLVARIRNSYAEWAWAGAVLGIVCLYRATTPVYAAMLLALVLLVDMRKLGFSTIAKHYLVLGGTVAALAGWFYLRNFEYLHYYYFVWNTDANASLPLRDSVAHLGYLLRHIGSLLAALGLMAMVKMFTMTSQSWRERLNVAWVALAGAVVPAAYLVLSGAGTNPFVSMAAVPGLLLFALYTMDAHSTPVRHRANRAADLLLILGLCATCLLTLKNLDGQISTWIPQKQGIEQLIDSIEHDSATHLNDEAKVTSLYLGGVDVTTLTNTLIFDRGYRYDQANAPTKAGSRIQPVTYGFAAEAEWTQIPGATDQEKLSFVTADAMRSADYLIVAEPASELPQHHRVNLYKEQIWNWAESNIALEKIRSGIRLSEIESVTVYRVIR